MVHGGLRSSRSRVNIIAGTAASDVSYESIIGDIHGLERNRRVLPAHSLSPSFRPFAWSGKVKEGGYEHRTVSGGCSKVAYLRESRSPARKEAGTPRGPRGACR